MTGEVVAEADTMLSREKATEISARGINNVIIESTDGNPVKVFGNGMVFVDDFKDYLGMTAEELGIKETRPLHRPQGDHRLRRTGRRSCKRRSRPVTMTSSRRPSSSTIFSPPSATCST
ncbi:MAG: hypothetical protein ACLR4Z_02500 [Butyricicoccaceae bacterium]